MTVGVDVPMVMAVGMGSGRDHGEMLYYNITQVHRLVRNCRRYSSAPTKGDRKNMLFCSASVAGTFEACPHARCLVANRGRADSAWTSSNRRE